MAELVSKENNEAVFTVEVDNKDFEKAINNVYQQTKGQFNIEGFRKGKAPRKIIELQYGQDFFYEDALNDILNEIYGPSLEDLDLEPIDYPVIDLKDELSTEKPFTVEFKVQLMPEAQLKDGYKDAEIDLMQVELSEDDVDHYIGHEREKNARLVTVDDRPAEEGDTLNIDFEGFQDGVAFEGGKGENYDLELGSNTFIPGFEEGLVGVNPGDELDLNVTFPENYHEELAGKDAVFKVTVNNIKTKELPELDDDFAMDVSEFDTFAEYKDDVRNKLEENVKTNNKNESYNKAIEALVEYLEVDIPEVLIENQIDTELKNFEQRLAQMGINLPTYYEMTQTSEESVREELRPQAIARLKSDFTIDALIKAEAIEASEEELDGEIRKLGEQYNVDDIDKFVEDYKEADNLPSIEEFVLQQKALDKAVDVVNFNIVDEYDSGVTEIPEDEVEEENKEEDKEEKSEE